MQTILTWNEDIEAAKHAGFVLLQVKDKRFGCYGAINPVMYTSQ